MHLYRGTLAESRDECPPEFPRTGVGLVECGLHHDELRGWIDDDPLAESADHRELAAVAGQQPEQIAVAEVGHGVPRQEIVVLSANGRGVVHPARGNDLSAVP